MKEGFKKNNLPEDNLLKDLITSSIFLGSQNAHGPLSYAGLKKEPSMKILEITISNLTREMSSVMLACSDAD